MHYAHNHKPKRQNDSMYDVLLWQRELHYDLFLMSKLSRTKGATYEREVSNEIFDVLGVKLKRNLKQYQQSEEGDLIMGNYLIECKRRAKIGVHEFMDQADRACKPGQTPIVIMRADGKKSLAMMHLPDLLKLLGNEMDPHQSQDESRNTGDS